jgi:DNA-binding transcriptional LysR family regulator
MFERLFMDRGLSLDRLRALVETGAAGSMVKAAGGDLARQSQYSRQIKELESFFQIKLIERHGKGIRLTPQGRELARISRFFLLGLSNFQRGCVSEKQTFRLGGGATFLEWWLLPLLSHPALLREGNSYSMEIVPDSDLERRLHDLTLDFGVVTSVTLSRPLQTRELFRWRLKLWVPRSLCRTEAEARRAFRERRLALVLPRDELSPASHPALDGHKPRLVCASFLEAKAALERQGLAAFLPDFLSPEPRSGKFLTIEAPELETAVYSYRLAWNPRLLRLNPHAIRLRDFLLKKFIRADEEEPPQPGPGRPGPASKVQGSTGPEAVENR